MLFFSGCCGVNNRYIFLLSNRMVIHLQYVKSSGIIFIPHLLCVFLVMYINSSCVMNALILLSSSNYSSIKCLFLYIYVSHLFTHMFTILSLFLLLLFSCAALDIHLVSFSLILKLSAHAFVKLCCRQITSVVTCLKILCIALNNFLQVRNLGELLCPTLQWQVQLSYVLHCF